MPRKVREVSGLRKHGNKYLATCVLEEDNAAYVARRSQELGVTVSAVVNACIEFDRASFSSETAVQLVRLLKRLGNVSPEQLERLIKE